MVQIRTAGYGVTKNLGNYENYRVYLEGNLDEGESFLDAITTLKTMCETDFTKQTKNDSYEPNSEKTKPEDLDLIPF